MSFFEDASLVLIPSAQKTSKVYSVKPTDGTGDLTFTRSNDTATRVGPDGLIEKVRTNLILQSQAFNTTWTPDNGGGTGSVTITANSHSAPDGTMTADRVQLVRGTVYINIFQNISSTAGQKYTASVYLKSLSGTPNISILYDSVPYSVTLTTDWVRYSVTYTASGSSTAPLLGLFGGNSATADVVAWGYQLEVSDFGATDYIATTSAAVSVGPVANVPRLDYLNSSCPRLLLEPQRTNLILYSEQINDANWGKVNYTITANSTISPDGTSNADLAVLSNGVTAGPANSITQSVTYSGTITFSVFIKNAGSTGTYTIQDGNGNGSTINLNTFTIASSGGNATGSVQAFSNGWYRFAVTITGFSNAYFYSYQGSFTGNGTSGIYLWGAQAEAGAYATSYIPTLGSASTRGSDSCSKTGISSLIGQTEGTLFVDFDLRSTANTGTYDSIINIATDANNSIDIVKNNTTTELYVFAINGGVIQVNSTGISGTNILGSHKLAVAYKLNDYAVYLDGVQVFTDTSATVPACSNLYLGAYLGTANQLGGAVNQALLFKTRLSNADLAALTA